MGEGYESRFPVWTAEFQRAEKIIDTSNALRAIPTAVKRRLVSEGRQRFVAFDLNDLLNEGEAGRPGHLYD